MKKLKPVPEGKKGKGLSMLPKATRNNMGFMAGGGKAMRKAYAYGSTVRSPMNADKNMNMTMNPMMPRAQQGMMSGMMYGGMAGKKKKMMYGGMAGKKNKKG